ncbi:MAG: DUF2953 domain-containing protein [Bacillota bacterium]|nr:DUF2953 domain-containing protein [Bacillota bacterium]
MSWRVLTVLAGVGLILAGIILYLLKAAYVRVEIAYDRPQGEAETFSFQVWLPPLVNFQFRRQPPPVSVRAGDEPRPGWSGVLSQGWAAVREVQVVQRTLVSLARHQLDFLEADRSLQRGARFMLRLLERVPWRTEELSWVTRVGAGDPALTGMLSGLLWGLKGVVFGVLAERMTFERKPVIRVLPDFESVAFRTTFRCIVRARVRDIIRAGAGVWRQKRGAAWKTNTRLRV